MLDLDKVFSRKKSQKQVAEFLFRNGVRVTPDARFFLGEIEIAGTAIARPLDIDRRVVVETAQTINTDSRLAEIFNKLEATPLLKDVAKQFGFGAIGIIPKDPSSKGIILGVVKIIAESGISIRQITTDDPMFTNAEMSVVTDKPIPRELIDKMLRLPEIEKVVVIN
jgi:predicted regulator of amino acid metabolism with ACT domain